MTFSGAHMGLGNIMKLSNAVTRSISAENVYGERGRGGMAEVGDAAQEEVLRLGQVWRKEQTDAARDLGLPVHNGGTYVNMDGPAFSTRAESETHRKLGFDVIGMTNLGEVRLAREAEIAIATMAMITDYDCWKTEEEPVTAEAVIAHLMANAAAAKQILARVIPQIPAEPHYPEHRALDSALVTDRSLWPAETVQKLGVILERFADR